MVGNAAAPQSVAGVEGHFEKDSAPLDGPYYALPVGSRDLMNLGSVADAAAVYLNHRRAVGTSPLAGEGGNASSVETLQWDIQLGLDNR